MLDSERGKNYLMRQFQCDDEFSRLIPGKKVFVSIRKTKHEQKRLILFNLKKVLLNLSQIITTLLYDFCKFFSLWYSWCTLVGPSGSHSACVFTIH